MSFLIVSCNRSDPETGNVVHPREEYVPHSKSFVGIKADNENIKDPDLLKLIDRLKDAHETIKIGAEKGSAYEIFGEIKGVTSDESENIIILDSQNNDIRIFDRKGDFLFAFGKGGPGPDEFMSPEDIKIGNDGKIYIADRYNAIKVFERNGKGYEYLTTIKTNVIPEGLCVLQNKLFVRGVGTEKINSDTTNFKTIHVYSTETGDYQYSFGQPYKSPNAFILKQISGGTISCNKRTNTIVYSFDLLPYIYGYSIGGDLRWVAKVDQFSQRPIVQGIDNSIQFESTEYKVNSIQSIIPIIDSKWMFVQLVERPTGSNLEMDDIRIISYLISSEDGTNGFLGDEIPMLLFANQNLLYTNHILTASFPELVILNY